MDPAFTFDWNEPFNFDSLINFSPEDDVVGGQVG